MAKLIFKCPYIKPSGGGGSYVRYIATRSGVELAQHEHTNAPVTQKQQEQINDILHHVPDTKMLLEYEDYQLNPTVGTASEFITQAAEQNMHATAGREQYVQYIGQRPRVEKRGDHGLFSGSEKEIVLSQACEAVANHSGNVWTPIISLRREDAARLCYDNAERWQALLRSHAGEMAEQMKIHPDNFRWYAAFHSENHHPHVHMVCWSTDPKEGFLTQKGIEGVKSTLAATIFQQDREHIYEQKQELMQELDMHGLQRMQELCAGIKSSSCDNLELEQLLSQLSHRLAKTGGKKVYGYLKRDVKDLVDRIVDELECDPHISGCYTAWQDAQEQLVQTYTARPMDRLPLSQRKEFKKIKNMIIAEAVRLGDDHVLSAEITASEKHTTEPVHNEAVPQYIPNALSSATNLLRQLGKIFEQEGQRMEQSPAIQIDRKRRREIHEKKLAQGHAWDDREQYFE